jgi:hypothetical protein
VEFIGPGNLPAGYASKGVMGRLTSNVVAGMFFLMAIGVVGVGLKIVHDRPRVASPEPHVPTIWLLDSETAWSDPDLPMTAERRAENRRRIERIAEIGPDPTLAEVKELIHYLVPVIPELPRPYPLWQEGYSHWEAWWTLCDMGRPAWPTLLAAMDYPETRVEAFELLAYQGVREAFDKALSMPEDEELLARVRAFFPAHDDRSLDELREWLEETDRYPRSRVLGVRQSISGHGRPLPRLRGPSLFLP